MLDFSDQTYANILARQLERVTNSIDKREGSVIQTALGPESWSIEGIYLVLAQLQSNAFATTAVGEFLDYKAAERGVYRIAAIPAQREAEFNVAVPAGSRFSTIDGANSVTFVTGDAIASTDGLFHYNATCETAGNIGNEYTGALLPITPINGLTYAQLTSIIIAGADEEDDESLRARFLLSLEDQVFAGNIASYQTEILAQAEVGAVQVYPHYPGPGYVLCSILDANYNIATPALIEQIQNYICPFIEDPDNPTRLGIGFAPVGASVRIVTASELTINFVLEVQLTPGIELSQVEDEINIVIDNYLLSVRREWGQLVVTTEVTYPVYVYISQVIVGILGVPGVVNVTNITLNGSSVDLELAETGALQELPVKGTVTITSA